MKKSYRSTLILTGIFAGLLAWYFLYEKKYKPEQAEKEEQTKVLLSMPREAIQELIVAQRQGDEKSTSYRTLHFKKLGADWHMIAPVEDRAEAGAVSGLVSTLTSAKQDRVIEENPKSLEPFGLQNPKLKITVKKDSNSPAEELWIGSDTPVGSSVYAKAAGKPTVYRAPQTLRTSFDKAPSEYRDKTVLHTVRTEVVEAEFKTPAGSFVLKRGEGDQWLLSREGIPALDTEVNKTLNAVLEMRATAFAADKPPATALSKYGLSPAAVTITLQKKDGKTLLSLGKVKDKYYAKRGDKDVVYEISKDVFEKASRPSRDYEDKRLVSFNRFDVKRIKIEHGGEGFELFKDKSDWKLTSDPSAKIENTKVEDYLSRLQDARLQSYLAPSDKPKKSDLVVRLFKQKDGKPEPIATLEATKPKQALSVAFRPNLDKPFTLSETEYKKINAFKQEFLAPDKKAENKKPAGKS